jgi:hypothetical protein
LVLAGALAGASLYVTWISGWPAAVRSSPESTNLAVLAHHPAPVRSAAQACALVLDKPQGFFEDVGQVSVVYTANSEASPAGGGVWVADVRAKAINWNHSVPPGYRPPRLPDTDFEQVLVPTTGSSPSAGECRCSTLLAGMGKPVVFGPDC